MNALFALALLQETSTTDTASAAPSAAAAGVGIVFVIVYFAVILLMIASLWKVFVKAGKPGWAAIVPLYNIIVLIQIAGKPLWWIIIYPFIVFPLATRFGKGAGFAVGLLILAPIFWPMLAFGDAKYQPAAA
jgi:hypothetical protein